MGWYFYGKLEWALLENKGTTLAKRLKFLNADNVKVLIRPFVWNHTVSLAENFKWFSFDANINTWQDLYPQNKSAIIHSPDLKREIINLVICLVSVPLLFHINFYLSHYLSIFYIYQKQLQSFSTFRVFLFIDTWWSN